MPGNPISVRLDDAVRAILERDAAQHNMGLATYLRDLATERSRALRKAEIYEESRRVAELVRSNPEARAFHDDWGTLSSKI